MLVAELGLNDMNITTNCANTQNLLLFVPGNRPQWIDKACRAHPDALLIDLEDGIADTDKANGRLGLTEVLNKVRHLPVMVRINAINTAWHKDDIALVASLNIAAVMLPKVERASDVMDVAECSKHPVIALIESAKGLYRIFEIAEVAQRLAFGSLDFSADLALSHTQEALLYARSRMVLASRCFKLVPPIDGVTLSITDKKQVKADCVYAKNLGFSGKLLIHPEQVEAARKGFYPSETEIHWARQILNTASDTKAVSVINGKMVDAPVIQRARQILAQITQGQV